jgi:FtsP/CotA-like multicopper oxidase with cupredoxin domain
MVRRKIFTLLGLVGLALILVAPPWAIPAAHANAGPAGVTFYANSPSGGTTGTALRKFVDGLPGLGPGNANTRGQYIPIAVPDTTTFSGSDFYRIGIVPFTEQMHADLPKASKIRGYVDLGTGSPPLPHYGGPLIIAKRNRPVRVLYTNLLPLGNLFLPVDPTVMGSGLGPNGVAAGNYTQNRTTVHLHGGYTPWISDGMPYQFFTPANETSVYKRGVSYQNVPDMWFDAAGNIVLAGTTGATNDPGPGRETSYYPNQQGSRLQFYHDHAHGMTRLTVYSGQFAPYIITEPAEDDFIDGTNNTGLNSGKAKLLPDQGDPTGPYRYGIPLIIQDKTFVPKDVATQDSRWDTTNWGIYGDLWWPHVLEPNQSVTNATGANDYGRWDYGPWVWPNITMPTKPGKSHRPTRIPLSRAALPLPGTTTSDPSAYNTCAVPESFLDTPVINGAAYPFLNVQPKAYRFRILNACNDRMLNLSLFLDASGGGAGATATSVLAPLTSGVSFLWITNAGSGYKTAPGVVIYGGGGSGASARAVVQGGIVTALVITNSGYGYTSPPSVYIGGTTEVKMVPAVPTQGFPDTWPTDGRDGGAPDPATAGPSFIQIGNEGGFLPGVAMVAPQPVTFQYNRRDVTVLNVLDKSLFLGPAERADVIIDFSAIPAGTNVILYNDAPAPNPGFDPRYDYYSGDPDQTSSGGATTTAPGYGPNTRTIMQFRVQAGTPAPFNLAALQTALPNAYVATQPPPVVPETFYPGAYQAATDTFALINDSTLTFTPLGTNFPVQYTMQPKSLIELFDNYGRMNAMLGTEYSQPDLIPARSTGIGFHYIDPPTELLTYNQPQIWRITHNGVDTHAIHIHLVNMQLVNRVGWDGMLKPPDPNERGWKETIRMNPLEDIIVAINPTVPTLPFTIPDSVRPLDPTMPLGTTMQFTGKDAQGNPITVTNLMTNFGWEFMWHCHLLGHEDNDMMRPISLTGAIPVGALNGLLGK